jgi:hypothetical protein
VYEIKSVERKEGKVKAVHVEVDKRQIWDYIISDGEIVREGWGSIYHERYRGAIRLEKNEFIKLMDQLRGIFGV